MKESRNEKMLLSMDLVDDHFVEEARQITSGKIKTQDRKKRGFKKAAMIAASLMVVLTAFNLWLFLPFPAQPSPLSMYKDSEYYPIIEKLNTYFNVYTTSASAPKNNFEKILSTFIVSKSTGTPLDGSSANNPSFMDKGNSMGKPVYHETTDNQVEGVIEGDKFKRSDKYIYYLYYDSSVTPPEAFLSIYSIEGTESQEVGSYAVGNDYTDTYSRNIEIYLSQDCSTVYLVIPFDSFFNSPRNPSFVRVQALDVRDPKNVQKTADVRISGTYLSSRMIDDELLLLTDFSVKTPINFSDESTFIPQINTGKGPQSIPMDNIICPDTITGSHYTVACKLKGASLTVSDSAAFLSYASAVYVSKDNIFATRTYTDWDYSDTNVQSRTITEIMGISYTDDQFTPLGSVSVAGSVKNQYSLDEYNGILRIVTSTSELRDSSSQQVWNASLYCVDLCDWSIRAKVEKFAPEGESAESVRFDKDYAYVCTAEVRLMTDPVYFFDLSDLDNITYKDTGTIDGYSTSLVNFGDGYLLGIGIDKDASGWIFKVEIYKETDTGVESVCAYELPFTTYSQDYKSYYIDRARQVIGIGIEQDPEYYGYSSSDESRYLLLHFDESEELSVVFNEPLAGENSVKRGVWIDNYFYLFGSRGFSVDFKVIEVNID